jgi:Fe-S-cluster containining protein
VPMPRTAFGPKAQLAAFLARTLESPTMPPALDEDAALASAWLDAARDPAVAGELERIYAMVAGRIALKGPVCRASGRCCNFDQYGHRLYVTGLEAAYLVARLPEPPQRSELDAAAARGGCPFQDGKLCSVHALRPLGCRAFFCDPAAAGWQERLSEEMLGLIRAIHDRRGIAYRYGEWRGMLGMFVRA